MFQRVVTGGVSAVLASWAAASRWRGHLLTVRSTALLLLSGCVVGDEGLVFFVCLTFVPLVVVKKALEPSTSMPLLVSGISER